MMVEYPVGLEQDMGSVKARLDNLEKQANAIQKDMREVRDTIVSAKGGWKTIAMVAGFSAAFGGLAAKFAPWLGFLPK